IVAAQLEAHLDLLVAVADLIGQAEDAEQVDVALDSGLELGEVDAARRSDVGQARSEARRQGVQHEFDRRRRVIGAHENGRMIGVERPRLPVGHLLHRPVETVDGRLVVRAADPPVGGAELELGDLRRRLHRVERGEERCRVDAVACWVLDRGHHYSLLCWLCSEHGKEVGVGMFGDGVERLWRWIDRSMLRRCSSSGHNLSVRYRFADRLLDTTRYELLSNGEQVHVEPQVFDVLAHLVEHRDRVVPKTELLDTVWGHQFVTESALTTRVKQLRQAVGDNGRDQRIVQTVHGRGYRFIAPVEELAGGAERTPPQVPDELRQEIRFCMTPDGTRLAYATVGSGPPLVRAAHWITHLDYDWQSPAWRHWLVGLARRHRFVRYDERGCGLSDHNVADFSLDARVQDLETVV